MNAFWNYDSTVSPEWFFFCLGASLLALPVLRFFCADKKFFLKLFGGFLFLLYFGGYFIVLILFVGIGSNLIKLSGILPESYFDLNKHAAFWDLYIFIGFSVWYITSLIIACKIGRESKM